MVKNNTILVIDDSSTTLLLMEFALKEAGYDAKIFSSVNDAIGFLRQTTPAIILLDLSMPDVSGFDFLKMKTKLKIENIPIIVVSAFDTEKTRDTVIKLGATEFLPKPLRIEKMLEVLKKYL
jgi:DNA-binding response OmpR family regulator